VIRGDCIESFVTLILLLQTPEMSLTAQTQQGPVFVIIRFPLSRFQACKNSLVKNLSIHRNYSGEVSGLSQMLQVIEGTWPRDRGVAILSFKTFREAELWKDSVPEIRQQDWLDGVDFLIVPITGMPPEDKRFVQLLDLHFHDFDKFLTEYSSDASAYLQASGAHGGIVSTNKIHKVKGLWDPEYLVINFWSTPQDFEAAYTSEVYQPMKEKRFLSADTNSCIFQLEPLFDRVQRH
jgi:uncharacterized protein (DUF1330 family)